MPGTAILDATPASPCPLGVRFDEPAFGAVLLAAVGQ